LSEKGSIYNILGLYQGDWKDGGLKQRAGMRLLSFLLEKEHVEEVGAFFWN